MTVLSQAYGTDVIVKKVGGEPIYYCRYCELTDPCPHWLCDDAEKMLVHLERHKKAGDHVPDSLVSQIKRHGQQCATT